MMRRILRVVLINLAVLLGMYGLTEVALHLVSAGENPLFGHKLRIPDPAFHHTLRADFSGTDTWGDQTYPVFKGYDEQGRMNELRTYRNLAHGTEPTANTSGYDLTSWTYNSLGLLANKRYADNQGPTYTYTPSGKLATRTWARGVITTYTYDKGLLTGTDYSDATPDVTITYDSFGRQTSVIQANQSRIDYTYDSATLALDTETVAYDLDQDGTADFTRVLDRSRDALQRETGC